MSKLIPKEIKDSLQAIDKELSKYDTEYDLSKLMRLAMIRLQEEGYNPTRIVANERFTIGLMRQSKQTLFNLFVYDGEFLTENTLFMSLFGLPVSVTNVASDCIFAMVIDEEHCITKEGIEVICIPVKHKD